MFFFQNFFHKTSVVQNITYPEYLTSQSLIKRQIQKDREVIS